MKKQVLVIVGALLFVASGCSSTVTLGTAANEDAVIGASADTSGASVTLPLIKGEDYPTYKKGLPEFAKLKNKVISKKLKSKFMV